MERNQFSEIVVFVEVARNGGFRAAADKLGITPGAVSSSIQRFENRLGVRLLERSTRSVSLTVPGEYLLNKCSGALAQISQVVDEINDESNIITGTLKISAPRRIGQLFLDGLLIQYAKLYPDVCIKMLFNDSKVDLLTSGIDLAVRAQTILDPETHAIPIGPDIPMSVVASPKYLERNGTPKYPKELVDHKGICFAFEDSKLLASWSFRSKGQTYSAMPKPILIVNDIGSMLSYCEQGLGLAYTFAESTREATDKKRLIPVLEKFVARLPKFSINYLSKRHQPLRVRAFIELAKQHRF